MAVREALENLKQELLEWNSATREQRIRAVNGLYIIATQVSDINPADCSPEELQLRDEVARLFRDAAEAVIAAHPRFELSKVTESHRSRPEQAVLYLTTANLAAHLHTIRGVLFLPELQNDIKLIESDESIVLRERRELEADDAQAKSDLRSARKQIKAASLDTTQAALRLVEQWVTQPSRYRSEFIRLKTLAQAQFVSLVEQRVAQLIRSAVADHYVYLDLEGIEELIEAAKRNARPADQARYEAMLSSAALSIARAHRVERNAKRDPRLWAIAEQQWCRAVNTLGVNAERPRGNIERAYCEHRAKQAHKQAEFLRAQAADIPTALVILRSLCDDPTLCVDGDVWLHHGIHCLRAVKDFFDDASGSNLPIGKPHKYASDARRSLQRAAQFQSSSAQATSALAELELWERLIAVQHDITEALTGSHTLTRHACATARAIVGDAGLPADSDALHHLHKFWNEQKKAAHIRLERQYDEERSETWDRLDALLGMLALDPDDARSRDRLRNELFETRRQFVAAANHAYNDASAGNFIERHLQPGNPPPHDEEIAQLQLEEVGRLLGWANNLNEAFHAAAQPTDILHQEVSKLEGWQRDLRALINGLNIARHRATHGLREPEQLDVARYVLGIGGRKPTTSLRQVPQMFVAHPSFGRCKAYVDECANRRKSQERLFRDITLCLQFDTATTPEQTESPRGIDLRRAGAERPFGEDFQAHDPALMRRVDDLIQSLRNRLQSGTEVLRTYPIEVALDKLREMERDEPADACGLQNALIYRDSDEHRREYDSLHAIMNVLQRKVRQVHILRDWLLSLTGDARLLHVGFPGVVNWGEEKKDIEALRDSGPHGLVEAQTRCRAAKVGTAEGTVHGLWSLERMRKALSEDSMMLHLRLKLAEADAEATDMALCTPARAINHERHELWLTYERQVEECDELACEVASRIERYASAWGEFDNSYRALMTVPFLRRRRIAESAEWQQFQRAAERFCRICPNYDVFGVKLHEVQARFKLQPECLDGRGA